MTLELLAPILTIIGVGLALSRQLTGNMAELRGDMFHLRGDVTALRERMATVETLISERLPTHTA